MKFQMGFLMAVALLIFSCKPAVETTATPEPIIVDLAQVKAEIQELENGWSAASNARYINTIMGLYADDAVSMPEGKPTESGKDAIKASIEADWAKAPEGQMVNFVTQEVYGDGEIVTEIGTSETKNASGEVTSSGKYFAIWKKVDGKYLCMREIYNSDAPTK